MARLNEPPAAAVESVDALKRRFLRQNRELAKTNSIQSLRIRCLESEVSRLLTENLELREDILNHKNTLEPQNPAPSIIDSVRGRLESKMMELTGLIAELQAPPKKRSNLEKEPTQKPERQEVDEYIDRRLPTIKEDKQWPRLSLNNVTEIHIMDPQAMMESPDPGSPPVAQFRDEDAEMENQPQFTSTASPDEEEKEAEPLSQELSLNIETRRRRRDSDRMNPKRVMVFDTSPENSAGQGPSKKQQEDEAALRTSRKRKLGERLAEREEDNNWAKQDRDAFAFSLKGSIHTEAKNIGKADPKTSSSRLEKIGPINKDGLERKALSSKPINTDPIVSPKKVTKSLLTEKPLKPISRLASKDAAKQRIRDRRAAQEESNTSVDKVAPMSRKAEVPEEVKAIEEVLELPPQTPGDLGSIFSPMSDTQSLDRPTGQDTPPPGGLSLGAEPMGRTARRSRPAVNYAEPSLNSKMRRPTKELLDAVGKDGKPSQGVVSKKSLEKPTSQWKPAYSASAGDLVVKEDPPSPLGNKTSLVLPERKIDLESAKDKVVNENEPVITLKSRRTSRSTVSFQQSITEQNLSASQARDPIKQKAEVVKQTDMAIFDFTDSSPSESKVADVLSKSSNSRRHSSIGSDRVKEVKEKVVIQKLQNKAAIGRRKSMMV